MYLYFEKKQTVQKCNAKYHQIVFDSYVITDQYKIRKYLSLIKIYSYLNIFVRN